MKKIAALKIEYTYADVTDSEARMNRFYNWLINKAIDNLLKKQKGIDNNSTQKYTINNEKNLQESNASICKKTFNAVVGGQSQPQCTSRRGVFNTRTSGDNFEGQKDYHLQDVQDRQASSGEVWQGLENKQQEIKGSFGGEV